MQNPRAIYQEKIRPYTTYCYYFFLPIVIILVYLMNLTGLKSSNSGFILLLLTIFAHIYANKLKLMPKRKHVAPILMYIINVLSFLIIPFAFMGQNSSEVAMGLYGLISLPLTIVSIIFFFLSANDLKKVYPNMKSDSKAAREEYKAAKASQKKKI